MKTDDAVRESRLRSLARRMGYSIRKSRAQTVHGNDLGDYMVVNDQFNGVVLGERFNATLDDIEAYFGT